MLNLRTAGSLLLTAFLVFGSGCKTPASCSETTKVSYHEAQIECLTNNIYFEAGNESVEGKQAVAFVVMNRINSDSFPTSVCGVIKQKNKGVCQFSWWCSSKLRSKANKKQVDKDQYSESRDIAQKIYSSYGQTKDITKGALYYHAKYVKKRNLGVKKLHVTAKIGKHIYYDI